MGESTQELFLLEFLVDKVNIPSVQAVQDDLLSVKTCIEFKILNLPAIYVSQDSANDKCTCLSEDPQVFRKGKSCLFALSRRLVCRPLCSFPICMTVYKKLPPSVLPDVMTIGSCQIEVRDMVNCLLEEPEADRPCKTLKNNFRISTATGQCVGEICVFIRFSRLGRKIVTQFQNPHNKRPYLFKGNEHSPVFQCRKLPSQPQLPSGPDAAGAGNGETEAPPRSCCGNRDSGPQELTSRTGRGSRRKAKPTRPCCPAANKQPDCCPAPKCQSQPPVSFLRNCEDEQRAEKTRACGCAVKKKDPYSCAKDQRGGCC